MSLQSETALKVQTVSVYWLKWWIVLGKNQAFKTDIEIKMSFQDEHLFAAVGDEAQLEFKDMQQIWLGCKMMMNGTCWLTFRGGVIAQQA